MHDLTVPVGEDLDLDVAWPLQVLLDQHPVVAEARGRLAPGVLQGGGERPVVPHHPHALAAAAGPRLDQHRPADRRGMGGERGILLVGTMVARHHGHARRLHQALGLILQPHRADRGGRRADEDDAGGLAGQGEVGVLGEEAVAGMDRFGARGARDLDDPLAPQIALGDRGRPQPVGLVGERHVQRIAIRIGVDGDAADAQAMRGPHHPAGDLPTVGDQDALEHFWCAIASLLEHHKRYILNTPKRVSSIGRLSAAERLSARTSRVLAGSITPSSHSRAEA